MKRKLLLAALCVVSFLGMKARTDVTSTYLTDAALENEGTNWALVSNGGNHAWDDTNKYHESWHNTFTITQTTGALPAGYYQLSIQAAVEGGNSTTISLQATSGSNSSVAAYPKYSTAGSYSDMAAWWAADATGTGNRNLNRIFTTVYVEEGQTLTATFKQTNNGQWFVYGQMQLHKLTDAEGRMAQYFEAVYNPMTNLDMASGRYKQRFENYTAGTVTGKKLTKTISGLPNGKYNVTLNGGASYTSGRGFDGNTGDGLTEFFANNASTNVTVVERGSILNGEFVDYTASGGIVTDGDLEVGYNNLAIGANWFVGSIKYIEYLGTCLVNDAVALPVGGAMAADTWYYFDIAVAGDNYDATATNLKNIVYTTDGTILLEDEGVVTATFSATGNSLSATRYYVKSSSAQTSFSVAPASYTYTVGSATADKAYIQPGNTVTVSYEDLLTDDPSAVLTKNFSGITFNSEPISFTPTANGFTFTVPNELTVGSDYTLYIPAEAIGYAAGSTYNDEQNITLKTPAIYDGLYYFYNTYSEKYMSRGQTWGTQAILDNYGIPAYLEFDGNGKTRVKFFDNEKFLSDGGWLYADNATGGQFYVEKVVGGYKFKDVSTGNYVAKNTYGSPGFDAVVGDAVEGVNLVGTSNIWALETPAAYAAKGNATTLANAQAATAATAAGLVGITTLADLKSELADNYSEESITITGAKAEKYNQNAWGDGENGGALVENEYVKETVEDLKPGIYRLTVDAFQRASSNANVAAAGGARSLVYAYAGNAKTQLKSVMDYGATSAYDSDFEYGGKHYPNNEASGYTALETGNYNNEVYVYVEDAGEGTGSLTFGINNPQKAGTGWPLAIWAMYDNFTLTYYAPVKKVTVTSAGWATLYTDKAIDFTGTGLTAYTATVSDDVVTLEEVDDVPANTGVVLKGTAGDYEIPVIESSSTAQGDLTGSTTENIATPAASGTYYVLTKIGESDVQFNPATQAGTISKGKAYLHIGGAAKVLKVVVDGQASDVTAPAVVETEEPEILFNMAGIQVDKNFKGFVVNQKGEKRFNR